MVKQLSDIDEDKESELDSESISLAPPPKLFSENEETLSQVLEQIPTISTEEPDVKVPERNPKMYQLVQMNSCSSFWWDSTDSDNSLEFDHSLDYPDIFEPDSGSDIRPLSFGSNLIKFSDGNYCLLVGWLMISPPPFSFYAYLTRPKPSYLILLDKGLKILI